MSPARPIAAAVLAVGLMALSGCMPLGAPFPFGQSDARKAEVLTEWAEHQPAVLSADVWVSDDPWNHAVTITLSIDPAASDTALTSLTSATLARADDAGWGGGDAFVIGLLGDDRSYSSQGGEATLEVFLALRHDPSFRFVSARGVGECAGAFCVELAEGDATRLHAAVQRQLAAAREAGGVQTNLDFAASDGDGRIVVAAQLKAPIDEAVALLELIDAEVDMVSAWAHPVPPVGDLPPLQLLGVTVADEESRARAEALGEAYPGVDLSVTVADPSAR